MMKIQITKNINHPYNILTVKKDAALYKQSKEDKDRLKAIANELKPLEEKKKDATVFFFFFFFFFFSSPSHTFSF